MREIRVLICDRIDVENLGLDDRFAIDYRPGLTRDELLESVSDCDVLLVRSRTRVDREVIERGSSLRVIARPGSGLDNIDLAAAESRGISVVNTPESLVEAVSEHVILLMLALSRRLVLADTSLKAGRWTKDTLVGSELKGKTLGIVGLGRIGRRVGEIAKSFGMSILGYDIVQIPPEFLSALDCRLVSLDALFATSDFVTIHVPLTPQTRYLVDSGRLSQMKKTACLVNTSRGGVIEEKALIASLKKGNLGGAALDVFEREPPTGEILTTPNLVLTPHIAGQTLEAQSEATRAVGAKLMRFFAE